MSIIRFLETLTSIMPTVDGYVYKCVEELILREGIEYRPAPLPKHIKKGRIKECYKNAYHTATREGLEYVEGYALSEGLIPVHHAWCVDADGVVIDPTWNPVGVEYIGVVIPIRLVELVMLNTKVYGVMHDYQNRYPMLKEGFNASKNKLEKMYKDLIM